MMTKNTSLQHMLLDSFKHLLWAHEQLALVLAPLPAAAFDQNLGGSFPGLRHCLHHVAAAEKIWLLRITGQTPQSMPQPDPNELPSLLIERWLHGSAALLQTVEKMPEQELSGMVKYQSLNGTENQNFLHEILSHVLLHSTFHRGQIVHMLRQLGLSELPATDYIVYTRMRAAGK
ncbi:MAG: DinB family protein [Chitinophagaceae bacterium]|nr:DinB family protein [Chitinophagaceae bacterium]